jgi:hypothetical protein
MKYKMLFITESGDDVTIYQVVLICSIAIYTTLHAYPNGISTLEDTQTTTIIDVMLEFITNHHTFSSVQKTKYGKLVT